MQQQSLFHLWSLEWKINTLHTTVRPLELQSDTWHRKQQSAVRSSWRDRMLRGYRDFLSLFRERVESTTQSDQSGILTFTSHSFDHAALWFLKHLAGFQGISSTHGKAKVVCTRWSDFNESSRVGGQDYSAAPWSLLLYLGWALLEKPQHPITKIQASIKRDHTVKMKSNDRFSQTSASCPAGRPSTPTISHLQTSLDVTLGKVYKRTNV